MTTYYKILRTVKPSDLVKRPSFAGLLKIIPPDGYVTSEHFKNAGEGRAYRGIRYAYSREIIKRISPYEHALSLSTVKFWCTQLNKPGHKRISPRYGTRELYMSAIAKFDEWLPGRPFKSHETVIRDGRIKRQAVTKSFANVEELLYYCTESDHGAKTARRAIREYLSCPEADKMSVYAYSMAL